MRTLVAIVIVGLTAGAVDAGERTERIRAAHFPTMAARIELFEARLNADDPEIRKVALNEITYFSRIPVSELERFLRRMMRDGDPVVRGRAIKKLHDLWIAIEPTELPRTFSGYHDGQRIDREDETLARQILLALRAPRARPGWAAYVAGLLRLKETKESLVALAGNANVFVRYAAGRALFDMGERRLAATAFEAISQEQTRRYARAQDEGGGRIAPGGASAGRHPWYALLACRGLMALEGEHRLRGLERLVRLYELFESSDDVNDRSKLTNVRLLLHQASGRFFPRAAAARRWHDERR